MPAPLKKKFSLNDLRANRRSGAKTPMLTCYDYTMARLMHEVGVPMLLVGDSAANVVLGHDTTLPVSLQFMIEITAAVRRGAPNALLVGDMPFGSYQASVFQGMKNASRMVKLSGCDCVKIEVAETHLELVQQLSSAGVAVIAHLGLRPQAVGLMGGYKYQGRTADEAAKILELSLQMEEAGAAALLLEAVPPEVSEAVVKATELPVIGCGAGPACHGSVIVTHDALNLTSSRPRFVPELGDIATPLKDALAEYVRQISSGQYPAAEHQYEMVAEEREKFHQRLK